MNLFGLVARLRRRPRSRGQSVVEFALILPLLLIFLATVLDLGRIYYANISLLNAAREGAFQASKTPDSYQAGQPCNTNTNLIVCRIQLESKGSMVEIAAADIAVSCSKSGCPLESSSTVTVRVDGQFQLITPILGFIFGGQTIDMQSSATQQIEFYPDDGVATAPPAPVAAFTASDTTGEAPFAISFDGTGSTGTPEDYIWDFGDGQYASHEAQVTHTYTEPGTYVVTLRIINLKGDDAATMTIQITAPEGTPVPTPTPTGTPTPTPTPTPACQNPPNVIGKNHTQAESQLAGAGWAYVSYGDLISGPSNKIQAQSPDHTLCVTKSTTTITLHYNASGG
ncbi:MAG TPA: PKD domain-containing protein [Candidatus Limnocylindrales bacterium]|nr:PKD domain-containing protein [Candidatus Limnocylindrales bacterium]